MAYQSLNLTDPPRHRLARPMQRLMPETRRPETRRPEREGQNEKARTRRPEREGMRVRANKSLFASYAGNLVPKASGKNREGAPAYALLPTHQLAQFAATGTLSRTFYATAREQLEDVTALAAQVPPRFIAQAAIWARTRGHMKDMPALLLAVLSTQDPVLLARAFSRVIDNGRMLR